MTKGVLYYNTLDIDIHVSAHISAHCNTLLRRRNLNIMIVNSTFLQHPQKRNRGNQLIRRQLTRTKSIGTGSRFAQAVSQTAMVDGVWS